MYTIDPTTKEGSQVERYINLGETLYSITERLVNGELTQPVAAFCTDVARKDGSKALVKVYIAEWEYARQAIDSLDWQKKIEEV